jgi:ankyrin repeat protein
MARALLPLAAFEQEVPGSDITLDGLHHNATAHMLKVVAYAVSNNFPDHCGDRSKIHKWLKNLLNISPDIVQLLQGSSNPALLQGLFRLAVEQDDLPFASALLDAGADPNDNIYRCLHGDLSDLLLRPLQYACLMGNLELARQLLRAKAQIEHYDVGLFCGPLILAIFGFFGGMWALPRVINEDDDDDEQSYGVDAATEKPQVEALLTLAKELLNAGVDVNAVSVNLDENSLMEQRWEADPMPEYYPLLYMRHSALTLASTFRDPELVDFLIRNGADVNFRVDGRSALRECLYTSEERRYWESCGPLRLEERQNNSRDLIDTANRLIMAGVDANDHKACHSEDDCDADLRCYSAYDLGILTQNENLVKSLRAAGAKPTRHSVDAALEARDYNTFCQLLKSDVGFPDWALNSEEQEVWESESSNWCMPYRQATERQKKRAMILAAIQLGECAGLEDLVRSFDCSGIVDNCGALCRAIGKCCSRGYRDTLVFLLQSDILPQDSLTSILASSIELAIKEGHTETVDVLLGVGADMTTALTSRGGMASLLRTAITCGRRELVQKLLDHGAEMDLAPYYGNLLVDAIFDGNKDIIQLLMAAGASPNRLGYTGGLGWLSPLTAALHEDQGPTVLQLLQLGASVNPLGTDYYGKQSPYTPLWAAVRRENIAMVERLVQNGARVSQALVEAASGKKSTILRVLLEKLLTGEQSTSEENLQLALQQTMASGGHGLPNFRLILQSKLLDIRAFPMSIHFALRSWHESPRQQFLQSLLEAGASPDAIAYNNHGIAQTTLLEAILQGDLACVKIILETQASTNKTQPPGTAYSPLQLAAFKGDSEMVRMLLDNGQDPCLVFHCSIKPDMDKENKLVHPFGTSVQNATMSKSSQILKTLLQRDANPNSVTAHCPHTPLQIACRDGSMELVELLIEFGANVNSPPAKTYGATALQFAAIGGYMGIAHLLLDKGAEVDAEPAEVEGRTALEGAAEQGRIDMVQLLKNAGADVSESGSGQYERALRKALINGHSATANLLRSFLLY